MAAAAKQKMDTPQAVRILNQAIGQWVEALREGLDVNAHRDVLAADFALMAEAMQVVTDWAP